MSVRRPFPWAREVRLARDGIRDPNVFFLERLTQRSKLFPEVLAFRYESPARALTVDLRVVDARRHDALFAQVLRRLQQAPAHLDDHRVRRTQLLLAAIDDRCDLDARWRVTELFCGNDAWRAAVLGLMMRSDLVAMDLRDFGPDNQGCIFELQSLIDFVPAGRVALLVDGTTDRNFLQATIDDCLIRVPPTSPNARAGIRLALIDVSRGEQVSVDKLLRMAASSS